MPALPEWQQQFQAAILQAGETGAAEALLPAVRRAGVIPAQRLAVYQDAYRLRLTEALHSNFPALARHLGEAGFAALAQAFLQAHPSRHASIRWFGEELAGFLRVAAPWADSPWLAELAAFEWALRHTVDAADATPLTLAVLQALSGDDWLTHRLALQPAATLLAGAWAVPLWWRHLQQNESTAPAQPDAAAGSGWLVYRGAAGAALWRRLDSDEAQALRALQAGLAFADLCEQVEGLVGAAAAPARTAAWLQGWTGEGLLVLARPG